MNIFRRVLSMLSSMLLKPVFYHGSVSHWLPVELYPGWLIATGEVDTFGNKEVICIENYWG